MIFYTALDDNGHRQLRGTQADAKAVNRVFEQIDIPTDKAGLMQFVQQLYSEIDQCSISQPDMISKAEIASAPMEASLASGMVTNASSSRADQTSGSIATRVDTSSTASSTKTELTSGSSKSEGYTEKSVRFEDEFDNMPLALQLHYAALAMENARDRL